MVEETKREKPTSRSKAANAVLFLPVIGANYKEHGRDLLGKRIMILGASNYCEKYYSWENGCGPACTHYGKLYLRVVGRDEPLYFGRRCEQFTRKIYMCYRERLKVPPKTGEKRPNGWMRTFSKFYNSFFKDGNPSDKIRNRLLDHLVCTEYMQGVESESACVHNDNLMKDRRNYKELVKQVKCLKPDVIIVWGKRVWELLCSLTKINFEDKPTDMKIMRIGNVSVDVIRVPHPASRKAPSNFNRYKVQEMFKAANINLLSCRDMGNHQKGIQP